MPCSTRSRNSGCAETRCITLEKSSGEVSGLCAVTATASSAARARKLKAMRAREVRSHEPFISIESPPGSPEWLICTGATPCSLLQKNCCRSKNITLGEFHGWVIVRLKTPETKFHAGFLQFYFGHCHHSHPRRRTGQPPRSYT